MNKIIQNYSESKRENMDNAQNNLPDSKASPEISIVIPVKDEAANIAPLVSEIMKVPYFTERPIEIIFVDDGSADSTLDEIKKVALIHPLVVRWISFDKNHGQTAAFDAGLKAAKGAVIVTMDGDLQNDPVDLPRMIQELKGYDMVAGYRNTRRDSLMRKLSSRIGNGVRNWATGDDIIDTGCSLKVFKRKCLNRLKLYEGMHRFFPTLLKMEGFRVLQIPVNHRPRLSGKTKYGIRNRLFKSSADLLAVCWMQRRHLGYVVKDKG